MGASNTFIVEEAQIAVTLGSDSGVKVWIGACAQKLTLTDEFAEVALQYHGEPFEEVKHVNESHKIEIENVWLLDTSIAPPIIPLIRRGQVLNMVIVWQDADTGFWNKRTYFNATGQIQRIGEAGFQNLNYRAQRMIPEAGKDEFDLQPSAINQVIYVDGSNRTPLYNFNPETHTYIPIDVSLIPSLAEIRQVTGDTFIDIAGVNKLGATTDDLDVAQIIAQGTTVIDESPRLEFWLNSRVGSLTASGKLVVGNVVETNDPESDPNAFTFGPSSYLGVTGLYAPEVEEVSP